MSGNGNTLPTTNPSAGSGLQGRHSKHDAPVRATAANPATFSDTPPERAAIVNNPFSSSDSDLPSIPISGSQLSASTAASSNAMSHQPTQLPVSSYSSDSKAIYRPREQSAQPLSHVPASSEPRTQPLPPTQSHPSTELQQLLPLHIQISTAVQPHSTDGSASASAQTPYSTGPTGMQSSYAYQPHPQSIFDDRGSTPDRSRYQSRVMNTPPPDYWSSAGQGAR
jgi:hypothetical protein